MHKRGSAYNLPSSGPELSGGICESFFLALKNKTFGILKTVALSQLFIRITGHPQDTERFR